MMSQDVERHERSALCKKLQERRENDKAAIKQNEADKVEFYTNGEGIERVREFRYLGQILCKYENNSRCIKEQLVEIWWLTGYSVPKYMA